jgi:hypothetical protein
MWDVVPSFVTTFKATIWISLALFPLWIALCATRVEAKVCAGVGGEGGTGPHSQQKRRRAS